MDKEIIVYSYDWKLLSNLKRKMATCNNIGKSSTLFVMLKKSDTQKNYLLSNSTYTKYPNQNQKKKISRSKADQCLSGAEDGD